MGKRVERKPKKRWKYCVNQDLSEKNLSGHEVHNRVAWKRLARNTDPI
jgi:hypothetical protein